MRYLRQKLDCYETLGKCWQCLAFASRLTFDDFSVTVPSAILAIKGETHNLVWLTPKLKIKYLITIRQMKPYWILRYQPHYFKADFKVYLLNSLYWKKKKNNWHFNTFYVGSRFKIHMYYNLWHSPVWNPVMASFNTGTRFQTLYHTSNSPGHLATPLPA